jgi:hypothetical protein
MSNVEGNTECKNAKCKQETRNKKQETQNKECRIENQIPMQTRLQKSTAGNARDQTSEGALKGQDL